MAGIRAIEGYREQWRQTPPSARPSLAPAIRTAVIDERQWEHACREAIADVEQGESFLTRYATINDESSWLYRGVLDAQQASIARVLIEAAQLVVRLQSLPPDPQELRAALTVLAPSVLDLAHAWQSVYGGAVGEEVDLVHALRILHLRPPESVQSWSAALAGAGWEIASLQHLLLELLGHPLSVIRAVKVLILIAGTEKDQGGKVAQLELEERVGGMGGIYPDPTMMTFFQSDAAFQQAFRHAWSWAAPYRSGSTTVTWRLTPWRASASQPSFSRVGGPSIGAGVALGLLHLLDRSRPPLEWQSYAITGAVTAEGEIRPVGSYPAKLQAAWTDRVKVLVPQQDYDENSEIQEWKELLPHLQGVSTIGQASEIASGLMGEVLEYLSALEKRLSQAPDYYRSRTRDGVASRQLGFEQIRQKVRVSNKRLQYQEQEALQREAEPSAGYFDTDEDTRTRSLEQIYQVKGSELFEEEKKEVRIEEWERLHGQIHRGIILGDPGFGKSWLLKYEGRRLTREGREGLKAGNLSLDQVILPFHLRLGTLAEAIPARGKKPITEIMLDLMQQEYQEQVSPTLRSWMKTKLVEQPATCVFLLDALDEVRSGPEGRVKGRLLHHLEILAKNPSYRILLTSRIVGYQQPFPLAHTEREREMELVAFDQGQVEGFIQAWFGVEAEEGRRLQQHLRQQPAVRMLARIPLLLSFLCLVADHDQMLPTRRSELYEWVLRLLLEAHWKERDQQSTISEERIDAKLAILKEIAWHFSTADDTWRDLLPVAELRQVTEKAARTHRLRQRGGQTVLEELSERDGVLVKAGEAPPGKSVPYLFLHRTFHEYLTASYLLQQPEAVWKRHVQEHCWFEPDWEEVIVLLAGCLDDPNPLLQMLLDEPYDAFHEMLLLAGRGVGVGARVCSCLADSILERLVNLLRSQIPRDQLRATQVLSQFDSQSTSSYLNPLLHDQDSRTRLLAVKILSHTGKPQTTKLLVELLESSGDLFVQKEVLRQLGNSGEANAVGPLASMLRSSTWQLWLVAAEALVNLDSDDAVQCLVEIFRDSSDYKQQLVARALSGMRRSETIQELCCALDSGSVSLKLAAVEGLMSSSVSIVDIAALIRDPDERVRATAVRALKQRKQLADAEILRLARDDPDPDVRRLIAGGLAGESSSASVETLLHMLEDTDVMVLISASEALARTGSARCLARLTENLRSARPDVQWAAALALGRQGCVEAVPILAQALTGKNINRRLLAVATLASIRHTAALQVLIRALREDPDEDVRASAVAALASQDRGQALPLLASAVFDLNTHVACTAVGAMGSMINQQVDQVILAALEDESRPDVRLSAALALASLNDVRCLPVLLDHLQKDNVPAVVARVLQGQREASVVQPLLTVWPSLAAQDFVTVYDTVLNIASWLRVAAGDDWLEWRARIVNAAARTARLSESELEATAGVSIP